MFVSLLGLLLVSTSTFMYVSNLTATARPFAGHDPANILLEDDEVLLVVEEVGNYRRRIIPEEES